MNSQEVAHLRFLLDIALLNLLKYYFNTSFFIMMTESKILPHDSRIGAEPIMEGPRRGVANKESAK